jgi:hypothetical protein
MDSNKAISASFGRQVVLLGYTQQGHTITLTATMYFNGSPASGKTITFYEQTGTGGFVFKGVATTNINGIAVNKFASTAGTHAAYAKFSTANDIPTMKSDNVSYSIGKVVLISPANGSIVSTPTPMLSWETYVGAIKYHVQVSTSSTFAAGHFKLDVDTTDAYTSVVSPALTRGAAYYWRVQALLPTGKSVYSAYRKLVYKSATSLTIDSVTISGSTVIVRARLVDGSSNALASKTLTFYDKAGTTAYVSKGTATTAVLTATTPGMATKAWPLTADSHLTKATFAGDTQYAASSSGETSYP